MAGLKLSLYIHSDTARSYHLRDRVGTVDVIVVGNVQHKKKGNLKVNWETNQPITISNINVCPEMKHNLLSVSKLTDNNLSVLFTKIECLVFNSDSVPSSPRWEFIQSRIPY
jgi:hypothetical protein